MKSIILIQRRIEIVLFWLTLCMEQWIFSSISIAINFVVAVWVD